MNLDLLTKLVRLANNNPNDNEANLAARRACKLIEEGKFNFGVNTSKPTTKPPTVNQQYENPFDIFTRYYTEQKQQTASEYAQHKEREQRQQQSQQNTGQYRCKNCGAHLEYIAIVMGDRFCHNCKATRNKEKQEQAKKEDKYGNKWEYVYYDEATSPKPKPKPVENVTVKCLFCKQDFKRKKFRSDFICHQCYVKKNKSEKPPIKDDRTKTYYKSVFCFACGHGFTVTYTELTNEMIGQVSGNCEKCKASYIRATR